MTQNSWQNRLRFSLRCLWCLESQKCTSTALRTSLSGIPLAFPGFSPASRIPSDWCHWRQLNQSPVPLSVPCPLLHVQIDCLKGSQDFKSFHLLLTAASGRPVCCVLSLRFILGSSHTMFYSRLVSLVVSLITTLSICSFLFVCFSVTELQFWVHSLYNRAFCCFPNRGWHSSRSGSHHGSTQKKIYTACHSQ